MSGDNAHDCPIARQLSQWLADHIEEPVAAYEMAAAVLEMAGNELAQEGHESGAAELWAMADDLRMIQAGADGKD